MIKKPKQKKCVCGCEESFVPTFIGQKWVNQQHRIDWLLNTEDGQKEVNKAKLKAKKKVEKDEREKDKKLLPVVHEKKYKKLLQMEINKLSRMIDAKFGYVTCIDCGKPFGNQIDAAHFNGVGSNHSIRYNLHNLHSAKSDCNQYSDKHKQGYTLGLKERYGENYLNMVESLPIKYKYVKLSAVEVYEKLKVVRGLIKNFETLQSESSLAMRETLNNIIGIYEVQV
jgi:hypothetical protein